MICYDVFIDVFAHQKETSIKVGVCPDVFHFEIRVAGSGGSARKRRAKTGSCARCSVGFASRRDPGPLTKVMAFCGLDFTNYYDIGQ